MFRGSSPAIRHAELVSASNPQHTLLSPVEG
jgi:hypothetical protein